MNRLQLYVWILTGGFLSIWLGIAPLAAQVIPDTTLPVGERSQITGNPNVQIDGGARRGGNLFHSFSQFSVPTDGSAYFNNTADVQTIFTRITGGSISNIDGVIHANGTANLFLLNPNGLLFGPNARLNIGGSFVATTADSINFADSFQYSATKPQTTPLLTVSVPVGLQMGANPGRIAVQGNGYDLSVPVPIFSPLVKGNSTAGLRVPVGQTLALIGGDIDLHGGTLRAEQGRIELGSVRDGQVNLSSTGSGFAFDYAGNQRFGNIRLSQQALADASGGGLIQVQGNQVSLTDDSLVLIQNQGTQAGGSIRVNAIQSLELSGTSPNGRFSAGLRSETVGVGSGADVAVLTRQLAARGGSAIIARSYSSARSGNVTAQASHSVQIDGASPINPQVISNISTSTISSGEAGEVTVSTQNLTVLNGGGIASITFGRGRGGNIIVNAFDLIQAIGTSRNFGASGLTASALGPGDAGQITVNTSRLVLQDGAAISTAIPATGNAGSIVINARESVEISGRPPVPALPSYVGSSAPITPKPIRDYYGLPDRPSGNSGSVTLNTPRLSITDGATVTVSNDGTGSAGTLQVNANSISLARGGSMTAATASGEGGNIALNVRDIILLRNDSPITASARGTGNGGNMRIDAGSIVAVPTENSDISANSVNARGGNISITAAGLFGIQPRREETRLSDITATGANSALNGTVQLNIERFDPTSGLVQLPSGVVDSSQ
ncbi:filamentous hemagglutinin N-terminal domain-containing protein [Phormidium sp. FACHB-592]|uniref:Filamentous hemagglutinin N-terminal domain-containing protein n=1 Tax=Stenomitos frigidus AS-A4 TaxID=2933935 RepID=A0ABV0KSZ1_9CYAN|nr:filamentous hemagglutinin N-terminal domain-containing protein [Phormidium sp. FACHB-592]MBD2075443.1 filamentous hemagglutinin N-terminal domain-containing protein [Phormidium sp. FACHB-592]